MAFLEGIAGYVKRKGGKKTPSQDGKQAKIFNEWSNDRFGIMARGRRAMPYAECHKAVGLERFLSLFPFSLSPFAFSKHTFSPS